MKRGNKCVIDQSQLDKIVTKFIINGIQPLRSVEDESFREYTFSKYLCAIEIRCEIFIYNLQFDVAQVFLTSKMIAHRLKL